MLFDDIKLVVSEVDDSWLLESIDACERLDEMCRLYDELAPTPEMWAGAPEWAQWCVIHANGLQYFFDEAEPFFQSHVIGWTSKGMINEFYRELELPIGIDWRLCKWRRPEVTK